MIDMRRVEDYITEGYTGKEIYEAEMCRKHRFQQIKVITMKDGQLDDKIIVKCTKCNCDDHLAQLMGVDPKYYDEKLEDLI